MHGIRRLNADTPTSTFDSSVPQDFLEPANVAQRINANFERISKQIEQYLAAAFHTIPGLCYMFGEADGAKTAYLLSNSQMIVWVIQGLAGISAASINEDKYGVVQVTLPQIIKHC
ncbi:Nucleoporin Ndc1 [Eumeta japonica]|uniref:Nucleoporin Ndc1 n=1 Tax=Eumeta variegata TaxID=151549 RepID=A0A4C1SMR3_EUMVA|nr:Nucleoporin Ndc1 [Eumeta japonica]